MDPSWRLASQLNANRLITTPENLGISSLVVDHFGLPFKLMKVQANLENVIVYESGGHYLRDFNCSKFGNNLLACISVTNGVDLICQIFIVIRKYFCYSGPSDTGKRWPPRRSLHG